MNNELAATLKNQHDRMVAMEAQLNILVAENERLKRETDRHFDFRLPEKFDGTDRSGLQPFLNQFEFLFENKPETYKFDERKIATVGSCLSGRAAKWFASLAVRFRKEQEEDPDAITPLNSFRRFKKVLLESFDEPDKKQKADSDLRNLRQGRLSVSEYASRFQELMTSLSWDTDATISQYRFGLNSDVKDLLINCQEPESLQDIISDSLRIDRRLQERRAEKRFENTWYPRWGKANGREREQEVKDDPMEIDSLQQRSQWSQKERRQKMRLMVCFKCNKPGHKQAECPKWKKSSEEQPRQVKSVKIKEVVDSDEESINSNDSYTRCKVSKASINGARKQKQLLLPTKIEFGNSTVKTVSFVDSGADNCFVSNRIVEEYQIPLERLDSQIELVLADGKPAKIGPITHRTLPVQVIIGEHVETRVFLVADLSYDVILGLNWLRKHDPRIIWSTFQCQFNSEHCLHSCVDKVHTVQGLLKEREEDVNVKTTTTTISSTSMRARHFIKKIKEEKELYGSFFY